MRKIKFYAKFMVACVIFASIFTQNVFAESTETDYQLAKLQPYIDELKNINSELGSDLAMSVFTPDEIASAYNNYCSMSVEDFRNYVVQLYNNNVPVEYDEPKIKTDEIFESDIETYGVVPPVDIDFFSHTQKIYVGRLENYFTLHTTCYSLDNVYRYESLNYLYNTFEHYPTYKPKNSSNEYYVSYRNDHTELTITVTVYWYTNETLYLSTPKQLSATLYAGGQDAFWGGDNI